MITFKDWIEFRDELNKIGWEHFTLASDFASEDTNGHKTSIIDDPYCGSDTFFGLKVRGQLIAAANVCDAKNIVYIGNFEVFSPHKRKGYGKKFYSQIERKYPCRHIMLNYKDGAAKNFWESMGFTATGVGTIMEKRLSKLK